MSWSSWRLSWWSDRSSRGSSRWGRRRRCCRPAPRARTPATCFAAASGGQYNPGTAVGPTLSRERLDQHDPTQPRMAMVPDLPVQQGLYDPAFEHDACGVGFVVDMHGRASHRMIELGISSLCHLDHRGATGAEANVGDGAGILVQVPDKFLRAVVEADLPPAGAYAVGCAFLPKDAEECALAMASIEKIVGDE